MSHPGVSKFSSQLVQNPSRESGRTFKCQNDLLAAWGGTEWHTYWHRYRCWDMHGLSTTSVLRTNVIYCHFLLYAAGYGYVTRDAGSDGLAVGSLALPWALAGLAALRSRDAYEPHLHGTAADMPPQHGFALLGLTAAAAASVASLLLLLHRQSHHRTTVPQISLRDFWINGRRPQGTNGLQNYHEDSAPRVSRSTELHGENAKERQRGRNGFAAGNAAGAPSGSTTRSRTPAGSAVSSRNEARADADLATKTSSSACRSARKDCDSACGQSHRQQWRRRTVAAVLLAALLAALLLHAHTLTAARGTQCV